MTSTPRDQARALFWRGITLKEIAHELDIPYGTLDSWKRRDCWDDTSPLHRIDEAVDARLARLLAKDNKSDRDLRELEHLARLFERSERRDGGKDRATPDRKKGRRRKEKDSSKNAFTDEQVADLCTAFERSLYSYQKRWGTGRRRYRERNILKSRQIGATFYFAREALIDAVTTGDNQIFLSASKAQAHVFRAYIVAFVKEVTDIDLKGDPITLWNGANLYFLGTNRRTAQSYHGHVYIDEYAWIPGFLEFRKVASAMSSHKKWRKTYFTTPSTINHDAHAFWSGDSFNQGRPKEKQAAFNVCHAALKHGAKCPDGQWRQIVTVTDAEANGCDLFDIDQLRLEYNEQDFANLFMCEWVDDTAAYFSFDELRACMVDSWEVWAPDFIPHAARPCGDRPVWLGYDPSESGDQASIVVILPPQAPKSPYRVLEKINAAGTDFAAQAEQIRRLCARYNVVHIGIDNTTIGRGVFELVRGFFPMATPITYSVEVKNRLVLKAKQLISKKQLQFDSGWTDVATAFMSIKKTMTPSGRQSTFVASRSRETGHADVAWAIMHALDRLDFCDFTASDSLPSRRSVVEFF